MKNKELLIKREAIISANSQLEFELKTLDDMLRENAVALAIKNSSLTGIGQIIDVKNSDITHEVTSFVHSYNPPFVVTGVKTIAFNKNTPNNKYPSSLKRYNEWTSEGLDKLRDESEKLLEFSPDEV